MSEDAGIFGPFAAPDEDDQDDQEVQRRGLDRLRPDDRLHQQFQELPLAMGEDPEDGMPRPVQSQEDFAPPLAVETLVCLEDRSHFVVRDRWGDILVSFEPGEVEQAPNGTWRVKESRFIEALGEEWNEWRRKWDKQARNADVIREMLLNRVEHVRELQVGSGWVQVFPRRPQCKHMMRQLTDVTGNTESAMMERCCTARRDNHGEFMSVVDAQIAACELRDPHDAETREVLDRFDALKIKKGAERRKAGVGLKIDEIGRDPDEDLEGIVE